jgi:hypothetical protein
MSKIAAHLSQEEKNRNYIKAARDQGRREVRGRLIDRETSEQYDELIGLVPKKQIGQVLSAMVKLAAQARERGELEIDDDGHVYLINENGRQALN